MIPTDILLHYRCDKQVFVAKDAMIPEDAAGLIFVKSNKLTGIVAFGNGYPFAGIDIAPARLEHIHHIILDNRHSKLFVLIQGQLM